MNGLQFFRIKYLLVVFSVVTVVVSQLSHLIWNRDRRARSWRQHQLPLSSTCSSPRPQWERSSFWARQLSLLSNKYRAEQAQSEHFHHQQRSLRLWFHLIRSSCWYSADSQYQPVFSHTDCVKNLISFNARLLKSYFVRTTSTAFSFTRNFCCWSRRWRHP